MGGTEEMKYLKRTKTNNGHLFVFEKMSQKAGESNMINGIKGSFEENKNGKS